MPKLPCVWDYLLVLNTGQENGCNGSSGILYVFMLGLVTAANICGHCNNWKLFQNCVVSRFWGASSPLPLNWIQAEGKLVTKCTIKSVGESKKCAITYELLSVSVYQYKKSSAVN
jgi:hypothetical protein